MDYRITCLAPEGISLEHSEQSLEKVAERIVAAFREDRDADVYNLIEAGVSRDPSKLAWALARLAAATPSDE